MSCVCDKRVFVSNDIWRKFYGVYPKIAEALEPQPPFLPYHSVYLLFIMRFVQLHFIANTVAQTDKHTDANVNWYWCI